MVDDLSGVWQLRTRIVCFIAGINVILLIFIYQINSGYYSMTKLETAIALQEKRVLDAAKALRRRNFSNNLPFLILSEDLPEGQAYREYPSGVIEIQEIIDQGANLKSKRIKRLSKAEATEIRSKNGLC